MKGIDKMYLGIFKSDGERYTSLHDDVYDLSTPEKIVDAVNKCKQDAEKNGYTGGLLATEISDEDQEIYLTNEYIRNAKTGKPIPRPPYVPTIDEVATNVWTTVKSARNAAEQSGCPYIDKVLDTDSVSVQRINTAVQAAQVAQTQKQSFSIEWTMQDNSIVTMTIADVLGMPVALATYSNQLHDRARKIRDDINKIVVDYETKKLSESDTRSALAKIKFDMWKCRKALINKTLRYLFTQG